MVQTRHSANTSKMTDDMEEMNKQTTQTTATTMTDDSEVNNLIESLPKESQSLVKVLSKIIFIQLVAELSSVKKELKEKDTQIANLTSEVNNLKDHVNDLEQKVDSVDQYERRDTVILSGPSLPEHTNSEHTTSVVVNTIRDYLKINIKETDISIAHRLGPQKQQKNKPIIVKFMNRTLKYDLTQACIQLKPQLYINESLTPKRRNLLNTILNIRRQHKAKFQQCYTKDGTIIIKLRNSTTKHSIVDDKSLMSFLEKYPQMMDTYQQTTSQTSTSSSDNR